VTSALLLDEMLSPKIADELRRRGHDVVAVAADPMLRSKTDAELFEWARENRRRIVTENVRDFRPLLRDDSSGPGVIFLSSRTFPRSRKTVGVLIRALDAWLVSASRSAHPPEDWLLLPR